MEDTAARYIETMVPRYLAVMWREFHGSKCPELRSCLAEYYLDLVGTVARKLHAKLPKQVQLDDLISAGTFGLIFAIGRYDPTRRTKFETYAGQPIRGSIVDYLRSVDYVPRNVRAQAAKVRHAQDQLTTQLGRPPSEDELRQRLNLTATVARRVFQSAKVKRMISLTAPKPGSTSESTSPELNRISADSHDSPLRQAIRRDLKEVITRGLSKAERLIVVLYYYERMSMKEIGETLDLSESRVSQMHSSIIRRLRARMSTAIEELQQVS